MKHILPFGSQLFGIATDLLYPPHCLICGVGIKNSSALLCSECHSGVIQEIYQGAQCDRCAHPLIAEKAACPNCANYDPHPIETALKLDCIVAPFQYKGLLQETLCRFKYGYDLKLFRLFATLLEENHAINDLLCSYNWSAIVPIPLHHLKERERGFNQAALLAKVLAKKSSLPLLTLLKRRYPTTPQAQKSGKERLTHLQGAFALRKKYLPKTFENLHTHSKKSLKGNYLLVDDVVTTGATANECAKTLRAAGAEKVGVVAIARGVIRHPH